MINNNDLKFHRRIILSIVIPCFNEENTLRNCVERVLEIQDETVSLEIIIVDDASTDNSFAIAKSLSQEYLGLIKTLQHSVNMGKGAALRTGFKVASGDYVAIQDADLEYNPYEIKNLLQPLVNGEADVVIGSRFLSGGPHRVLYFWHYLGNKFLTFVSNMFTDLNLSDMESCYKIFKSEIIKKIELKENRFGFEPEIVAKVAHMRVRIFEMGISYYGRTYEEGKKIGAKDGFRALYCIFKYNAAKAPMPIQFLIYTIIGGTAAVVNLLLFLFLFNSGYPLNISAPAAFITAAVVNYYLSIKLLFRHAIKWNAFVELMMYSFVVAAMCLYDLNITKFLMFLNLSPATSKITASFLGLLLNFLGRKFIVFPEPASGAWRPQSASINRTQITADNIRPSRN